MKTITQFFIVLVFTTGPVSAQITFGGASGFSVDSLPSSIVSADFNGDHNLDLAIANYGSNDVSILLGDGAGGFGAATNFPAGSQPSSLICVDFNKNGHKDLAVTNAGTNSITILLGDGAGAFTTHTNFPTGGCSAPTAIAIASADFNTDGNPDIAVANYCAGNSIVVFLGDGTGSFHTDTVWNGEQYSNSIISGDFNGDGKIDLAVENFPPSGEVLLMLGDGAGKFSKFYPQSMMSVGQSLYSGDFNGDGKIDIAQANPLGKGSAQVFLGNGKGDFGNPTGFNISANPSSIVSGDFNGDGKMDLVSSSETRNNLSVLEGNGGGGFSPADSFAVGTSPVAIVSGDFNKDGKLDLAVANKKSKSISVLLNTTIKPACIALVKDSLFKDTAPLTWKMLPHYSSQVTNARWYWGDGTSTLGLYPSHTYSVAGNYAICVTAYTTCGDSMNTCRNDSLYKQMNTGASTSMIQVNVIAGLSTDVSVINKGGDLLRIYPNPTNGVTYIETNFLQEGAQIKIFNMLGAEVRNTKLDGRNGIAEIDMRDLKDGVYFLAVTSGDHRLQQKIILNKNNR